MANTGLGWFDPTYYGPSYVEDLKAISKLKDVLDEFQSEKIIS